MEPLSTIINYKYMNKKLYAFILLVLLVFPLYASADTTSSCAWVGNVLKCNTQDDIYTKLDALKAQYGSTNYYACYSKSGLGSAGGDPYAQNSGYSYMKYCLETMAKQDKAANDMYNKLQCANPAKYTNGAVWFNGRCVDYETGCKENFGPNSHYRGMDSNGKLLCEDKPPSKPTPVTPSLNCDKSQSKLAYQGSCKTVVEICKQLYGSLSEWGTVNRIGKQLISDDGGAIDCRCIIGSVPNSNQTSCVTVAKENIQPPPVTNLAPKKQEKTQPTPPPIPQPKVESAQDVLPRNEAVKTQQPPVEEKLEVLPPAPQQPEQPPVEKPGVFKRFWHWLKKLF